MSKSKKQKGNQLLPRVNCNTFITPDVDVRKSGLPHIHFLASNIAKAVSPFAAPKGEVKPKIGNSLYALLQGVNKMKVVYITSIKEANGDAARLLNYFNDHKPRQMVAIMSDYGTVAIGLNISQDDLRETLAIAEEQGWFTKSATGKLPEQRAA